MKGEGLQTRSAEQVERRRAIIEAERKRVQARVGDDHEVREFWTDFPFTKQAASGDQAGPDDVIRVDGYASTWVEDRDLERVHPSAFDDTLESYMSKNPIMLWQHNHDWPIGTVVDAKTDDTGLLVAGDVQPPDSGEEGWAVSAHSKIRRGIVRTFSIGGFFSRALVEEPDPEVVITSVDLFEISVVSVPSNPDSIFEAAARAFKTSNAKSVGINTLGHHGKALEQVEQLLGVVSLTDPDLLLMNEDERKARFGELMERWPTELGYDDFRDAVSAFNDGDVMLSLERSTAVMDRLYLPGGTLSGTVAKAGRVLSKSNENKLRQAHEAIGEVLAKVDDAPTVEDAEDPAPVDHDEVSEGASTS